MAQASTDPTRARGYRNKNPGNIDYNPANKWQGQIGQEAGPDGRFAVFSSHEYGIRALAALLTTYYDRHGLRSIRQIINRWAPPKENRTSDYVRHVSELTGHDPDADFDLHRYEDMRGLVVAIITHELGGQPYPARVIDEGLRLAGLRKSAHSLVSAATTPEGQSAIGWAGLATAAATAAPAIEAVGGLPPWI
ncbi:hypothetical protein HMPREF9946_02558, partial [Acetobacteraceae bacterium AT-5844]